MAACSCVPQEVCDECICNCKRGRCSACNSACKKCKCACNGTNGARKRGRQKGFTKVVGEVQRTSSGRTSAKRARLDIAENIRALDTPSSRDNAPKDTYTHSVGKNFVTISADSDERVNTILDIAQAFGWSRNSRKALPSNELRTNSTDLQTTHPHGWSTMSQIVIKAATRVANVVYPADAEALLRDVATSLGATNTTAGDPNKAAAGRVFNCLVDVYNRAPKNTIQKRVTRAILVKALSRKEIDHLKSCGELTLSGSSRDIGYNDWSTMDYGEALDKTKYSRARFSASKLEAAIKFILSEENVCLISWGTKSLRIGRNELVTLPALTRHKPAQILYRDYLVSVDEDQHIGKTSFMKVALSITNNDEKLITAVDYVTGCLVTDVVDTIQNILEDFSEDQTERIRLSSLVDLGKTFIKQQLDYHVIEEDDINTHGLEYALPKPSKDIPIREAECNGCKFMPWVVSEVKRTVRRSAYGGADVQQDALDVLEVCRDKLDIYSGHRTRVKNQQYHIEKILSEMSDRCIAN